MSQEQLIEQVLEEMWRCVQFIVPENIGQLCVDLTTLKIDHGYAIHFHLFHEHA